MKPGFFLLFLLFLSACTGGKEDMLCGHWQAAAVEEEGNLLDIDPSVVQFQFYENGIYTFSSTLNYREAGTFYLKSNYLYTTDTLHQASIEKAVLISKLTTDSLVVNMKEANKDRSLKMFKLR